MKKVIYQEDINNTVSEMMFHIDRLKGASWSSTNESNEIYEKLSAILEEEFDYPEFYHHD